MMPKRAGRPEDDIALEILAAKTASAAVAGMVEVLERATPGVRVEAVCVSGVAA